MRDRHRILVVEDDEAIRSGLADALSDEGYEVLLAADGPTGLARGLADDPDLIVLDLMLPGLDGFEILARLRKDHLATPVLVLTARGLEQDRVRGLDLGADDYVVKPFSLDELLARVRTRLRAWDRERGIDRDRQLRFGGVVVDFGARAAWRDGTDLALTPKEMDLLHALVEREGRAVSRDELLRTVWDDEDVTPRAIDMTVLGLRRKVERDATRPEHVLSVRAVGYRFQRSVTRP